MIHRHPLKVPSSLFVLILASALTSLAQYFPPPDSMGGWRTLTNPREIQAKTGFDVNKLDQVFAYIQGSSQHGGLLVIRHGWLVYERYFGRASRDANPNEASCGKPVTSIAMGILMHERPELFPDGLDQKAYTPRYLPPEAFPPNDPLKSEIKLGQLLAMTAGYRGNSPGYVHGKSVTIDPEGFDGWPAGVDANAFSEGLWCKPGEGYSYASVCPHLVSLIIRHITGMQFKDYVETRLAKPLGWGRWGYGWHEHPETADNWGGRGIALHSTDMLRFGYLLLHDGRWADQQIVPADYVHKATTPSPYNPHFAFSLQFELNTDGGAPAAPRDLYWKRGGGGFALGVVPSLDLVVWKMGGRDDEYEEKDTGLPELKPYDGSRAGWKPAVEEGAAALRALEMIVAAIDDNKK